MAELFFDVPVNYNKPNDGSLRLFARGVRRLATPAEPGKGDEQQLPWLVYLQGGPGMGCRPPQDYGWVGTVLDKGYQVWISQGKQKEPKYFQLYHSMLISFKHRSCSWTNVALVSALPLPRPRWLDREMP